MISPNDIQVTKVDLTLFATVLAVSNVVEGQLFNKQMFNEAWKNNAIAVLLGVALHSLLTNKVSAMVNTQLKGTVGVEQSVYDLVKFGTIFAVQRAGNLYLQGRPVGLEIYTEDWLKENGSVIAGYAIFNMLLRDMVPTVPAVYQPMINDFVKVSLGFVSSKYIMNGFVTQTHLLELSAVLAGFAVFHLATKSLVVPKEKFASIGGLSVYNRRRA